MHKIFGRLKHFHFEIDQITSKFSVSTKMSLAENLKKAFIKTLNDEKRAEIKFKYVDPNLGLDRFFTLRRHYTDNIDAIKSRLFANIDKASQKHRKKQRRKSQSENDDFEVVVEILHNKKAIDSSVILEQILKLDNVCLSVNNQIFPFYLNPPEVKQVKLPNVFLAGFVVSPIKVELENCKIEDCEFRWSKSPAAVNAESSLWIPIGNEMRYSISNEDIGCYLKLDCLPKKGENQGLIESVVSTKAVEAGPGICPFELRHNFTKASMDHSGYLSRNHQ